MSLRSAEGDKNSFDYNALMHNQKATVSTIRDSESETVFGFECEDSACVRILPKKSPLCRPHSIRMRSFRGQENLYRRFI